MTAELETWAKASAAKVARSVPPIYSARKKKMLVVHLDGVPRTLLDDAIRTQRMPFLASLVQSGTYALDSAFWGSPASTPCFQAGLLYGLRHPNLPAYHWYDRELQRVVRMNIPEDAKAIESRLGRREHHSLLEDGGTAYLSLFDAFAQRRVTMTSLADMKRLVRALPQLLRGIRAPAREGVFRYLREMASRAFQTGRDVLHWTSHVNDWRHERAFWSNQLLIAMAWDFAHKRALIDMVQGVPAIYLVFGNYDEVAHRRGPRSEQATRELYAVDGKLAELYAVARTLPEPYDVFFVTDHGHVDSHPLERRAGKDVRTVLFSGPAPEIPASVEEALLDGRPLPLLQSRPPDALPEPEFVDAGNFAHLYFSRRPDPLEARDLLANHRDVLGRVIASSEMDVVVVRRRDKAVAIIGGQVWTAEDVQRSPLPAAFSKRAVQDYLRELPSMKTAGDIVLFGRAVDSAGTVGFAWEFGSHGGLTEVETNSLVLWPRAAPLDLSGLGHAVELHDRLSAVYRN